MIPNHGLIALSLLYGDDDFQKSLMICNTSGWDTDCNSGNVGCLMGIKNGLAGIESGPDWRGPVADRLYMPTADGGRSITDAVTEAYHIVAIGRALYGLPSAASKHGARYHFELPGSVQGFMPEDSIEVRGTVTLRNVEGHSESGSRSLEIHYRKLAAGRTARVRTPTFIPADGTAFRTYELIACPTAYPGQELRARVEDRCGQRRHGNLPPVSLGLRSVRSRTTGRSDARCVGKGVWPTGRASSRHSACV